MPIIVFGKSSNRSEVNIDTSSFVQKPYLKTNHKECIIEENVDLRIQYRIKNLSDPLSIREAYSKNYVVKVFEKDIVFNDVILQNIKFVKVDYQTG